MASKACAQQTKTKLEKTRCSRHLAQCGLSAQQLPSSHDDHPAHFGIIMKGYCCNCQCPPWRILKLSIEGFHSTAMDFGASTNCNLPTAWCIGLYPICVELEATLSPCTTHCLRFVHVCGVLPSLWRTSNPNAHLIPSASIRKVSSGTHVHSSLFHIFTRYVI